MTWQGKRRKQLPSNWGAVRKARLEYDGYRCTAYDIEGEYGRRCTERATDVHHAGHPLDHKLSMLRSVCAYHHNLETQAEAAAARARSTTPKLQRARPQAKHPGLA